MLKVKEINDKKVWESFLSQNFEKNFPFFQSWNWGDIQNRMGYETLRLGLFDEEKLIGVCLVYNIKAKRGHYLHLRHGPALLNFEKDFDYLISHVKQIAKEKGASFIRISPLLESKEINFAFFKQRKFKKAPIHNMDAEMCSILDIRKPEEELLKEMRKSHRYLIKKAKNLNIELIKSKRKEDVDTFLNLYKDFSSQKKFVAHRGVAEEVEVLSKGDEVLLLFAKYENKIISGVLIDFVGPIGIYHHAASNIEYKNIPSNYFLLWEAILEAKKRGKKFFNLWGIAPENKNNHPWSGFTLFKIGFGGERVEFIHAMDLPLGLGYLKTYVIDWVTKKRKGY